MPICDKLTQTTLDLGNSNAWAHVPVLSCWGCRPMSFRRKVVLNRHIIQIVCLALIPEKVVLSLFCQTQCKEILHK
jgi:hypothetical protein